MQVANFIYPSMAHKSNKSLVVFTAMPEATNPFENLSDLEALKIIKSQGETFNPYLKDSQSNNIIFHELVKKRFY